MLSSACRYGILASIHLARQEQDGYIPVRQIASSLEVSSPFLSKIMQLLVTANLLDSLRGPTGGVKLARNTHDIRVNDIVLAIDGRKVLESCVLGLPGCGSKAPCPMHADWALVRERFCKMLEETTLEELGNDTESKGFRLIPSR
jgi:Rrf2 family protein